MGFDVFGRKPINKTGEYFRNNVWGWRPLWEYVSVICDDILTSKDIEAGNFNNCYFITKSKAEKIANRLNELVKSGVVEKHKKIRDEKIKALPLIKCNLCKGTGKRNEKHAKGKCYKCKGKGKIKDFPTWYDFNVENVKEFAKFCKKSGGFEIC